MNRLEGKERSFCMKVKFLGETSKRSLEGKVKIVAGAAKLSHFNGNLSQLIASSKGYEDNLKIIGRITRSGHKSVMEHHYINLEISGVTPIIEQILIGFRLVAFTIKSRRYVDFRKVGYYIPDFRMKDGSIENDLTILKAKYRRQMNSLFKFYSQMVDGGIPKEDARFILPYSFYSEIAMSLNARELERLIEYLLYNSKVSKITEARDLGIMLLEMAKEYVPEIVEYVENYNPRCSDFDYRSILDTYKNGCKIAKSPVLVDCTSQVDDVIIKTGIMGETQSSYEDASRILERVEREYPDFRAKYMDAIIRNTENRELEQVNFTWQIPISLSILTHLTRHRMHSLIIPNFTPLWNFDNYIIPESIKNSEFLQRYIHCVEKNKKTMEYFLKVGIMEEDLIYFYLGCQMCNVTTTMNGRELLWISRLRACNRAQWQIREIVNYMIATTKNIAPLFGKGLGPTCEIYRYCPEGKLSCGKIKDILEGAKKN